MILKYLLNLSMVLHIIFLFRSSLERKNIGYIFDYYKKYILNHHKIIFNKIHKKILAETNFYCDTHVYEVFFYI